MMESIIDQFFNRRHLKCQETIRTRRILMKEDLNEYSHIWQTGTKTTKREEKVFNFLWIDKMLEIAQELLP